MSSELVNSTCQSADQTVEESVKAFSEFANIYDENMESIKYIGYKKVAQIADELFPNKDGVKILDLACGTGLAAEWLRKHGFTYVDGVDASRGMVDKAISKGVYNTAICAFVGAEYPNLPFEDNTYDAVTITGGMGQNMIPCSGIHEMIRLVKPGGYIINIFREEILTKVKEYTGRLVPLMDSLEKEGKWRRIAWTQWPEYQVDREAIITIYQVC